MILNSSKVEVFPSTRRNSQTSRLTSEQGFVGILNHIVDTDEATFVISNSFGGESIEFCIYGYYFKVNLSNADISKMSTIYAVIDIDSTNKSFPELVGQNVGGNYDGVSFVQNPSELPPDTNPNHTRHYLKILEMINGIWTIPTESKKKFDWSSFGQGNYIDCGEIYD